MFPFFSVIYTKQERQREEEGEGEGDNACLISWGKHSNNKRLSRKMQQPNALITRRATCDICQGHGQQWQWQRQREKQRQSKPFNEAFNALATLRLSTSRTTSVTRSCSERAIKPQPRPPLLCRRRGCCCPSSGAAAVFVAIPWRLQFRNRFGGKLKLLFVFSALFSCCLCGPTSTHASSRACPAIGYGVRGW